MAKIHYTSNFQFIIRQLIYINLPKSKELLLVKTLNVAKYLIAIYEQKKSLRLKPEAL